MAEVACGDATSAEFEVASMAALDEHFDGPATPARMFVSHSSKDREAANTIVDAVEQAGFPCWIAPRNISPGRRL